ncbi:hypothetical protein HIM_02053 [Hirsutella minnesotensis 3608]|nr:hypothetical protein HIM_02053 [Hirsutella minnesotensis 3608]
MPTQHVEPQSHDLLGDISNALLKARKVVVVTGAGISTNSGIPDFRSENGLYSLVQAQFEAAARQARRVDSALNANDSDVEEGRSAKRRKLCRESSQELNQDRLGQMKAESCDQPADTLAPSPCGGASDQGEAGSKHPTWESKAATLLRTPKPKLAVTTAAEPVTSPLSSPPAESLLLRPSGIQSPVNRRLIDVALPQSSSPLSSPPPTLFDSFDLGSPLAAVPSSSSSTSPSDVDDSTPLSALPCSSQTSASIKATLPNMKGKDLFDANIWADPIRTSVFYTFTTSLRQKIKSAEPTSSHQFIRHLRDRGKLVRCYTQNIDQIEEKVGLSTSLKDGPGSRGRFSRRSTATTNQLNKMVDEVADESCSMQKVPEVEEPSSANSSQQSQAESSDGSGVPATADDTSNSDMEKMVAKPQKREAPRSGVECVFLHGSLELLRCFLCGRVCSWDDEEREAETLAGLQPECPHCVGATAAREERGKRALGVGKLRPDIVLYGEEHPNSHLISPIVTHDLGLHPDMLLILGTSLRVHGLKVMVREFAKAVHSRGGKVVFVNFTKPPESSWGDVIDYWVQWDCDAWVGDLQDKIPKMWQAPEPPKPRKKRDSGGSSDVPKEKKQRPPAANPVALRDTKATGAYWVAKVLKELGRITGKPSSGRRASMTAAEAGTEPGEDVKPQPRRKTDKPKIKPPRKSAPGVLERCKHPPSTLNPNHGRSKRDPEDKNTGADGVMEGQKTVVSSILSSVKENPRIRKRKKIDGVEVPAPSVSRRRGRLQPSKSRPLHLKLAPLRSPPAQQSTACLYGRPQPLEPRSPPSGPLASLSPNLRSAQVTKRPKDAFCGQDWLARVLDSKPHWSPSWGLGEDDEPLLRFGSKRDEVHAVSIQKVTRDGGLQTTEAPAAGTGTGTGADAQGKLMNWGSSWSCRQ